MARFQDKNGVVSVNGFFQKVAGSTANSLTAANYYSTEQFVSVPFTYTKTAYTANIPTTALIVEVAVAITTAITGTSPSVSVGSTAGGTDIATTTTVTAGGQQLGAKSPTAVQASATPGVVNVTVGGTSLTAGAGYVMIGFINTYQSVPV